MEWYNNCTLCPRNCHADREKGQGLCRTNIKIEEGEPLIPLARAALHYWEEPCISGEAGSGAVFFSGCSLGCIFCQNREISTGEAGKFISEARLTEIFLELQEQGALNINLVTAGHVLPIVRSALQEAKKHGLTIPIVYNTSSYERPEAIRTLDGLVDIYLPDLKYISPILSGKFSLANDYPDVAKAAIAEMYRQTGPAILADTGLIKKGLVVRHLVLPGCTQDSNAVLSYLHETYGDNILISIMNQYTPTSEGLKHPLLKRKLRPSEYAQVVDHALSIGITNGYTQSSESAAESFIPPFDFTGV